MGGGGRRGPAPVPTQILKARGSARAKLATDAPKAEPIEPQAVGYLRKDAECYWPQLVEALRGLRVLAFSDGGILVRYCNALAALDQCEKFLEGQENPCYQVETRDGKAWRRYPQVADAHKLRTELLRMEQDMGLTPSARSRIKTINGGNPIGSGIASGNGNLRKLKELKSDIDKGSVA